MKRREFSFGILSGIALSVLIGLFAVPALGLFEMTATGPPGLLDWWGDTNWKSSLRWRAPDQTIPAGADPEKGLTHYKATCLQCHGAPNVPHAEWAAHMQPVPPQLWSKETQQMSDGELFHVVNGGIRMTGMPAFGPEHSREDLWNMVAFIRQLNDLSQEQKQALKSAAETFTHEHQHEHGGQGGNGPSQPAAEDQHPNHEHSH